RSPLPQSPGSPRRFICISVYDLTAAEIRAIPAGWCARYLKGTLLSLPTFVVAGGWVQLAEVDGLDWLPVPYPLGAALGDQAERADAGLAVRQVAAEGANNRRSGLLGRAVADRDVRTPAAGAVREAVGASDFPSCHLGGVVERFEGVGGLDAEHDGF